MDNLFLKFLDVIYDEKDNFFEIIFDNANEENEINSKSDSEDDDNNGKYTEKELKMKLSGNHLYNEPYKKYYDDESARSHLEYSWKKGQMFNRYFCCHDFNDMLNITYINNIKGCKNQSLCK